MSVGLEQQVEALIFASKQSITLEEILQILQIAEPNSIITQDDVERTIEKIDEKYKDAALSVSLQYINNGYQILTKPIFHRLINQLQSHRAKKKLSQAALETLSIIAYKQPITKLEIEQIRGVNCDYSIQRLLEKDLISIIGKSKNIGKPLLYGTSNYFMDYFGINSSADLPKLKDILFEENTVGENHD
ncbi:MAG TPA: SMC-Scp complex subunit ScpB [Sphingobacteriaceae bacterium]|nr:SMC-Scp complex subunit ScpB [Sphingobacteriaceae bacterium]